MTKEIDLILFWKVFKKCWWKLLIIALIVSTVAALFTQFVIKKEYTQKLEFYVKNSSISNEYTNTSLTAATSQLANDYIKVISSDIVLSEIEKQINEKGFSVSAATISSMISSKAYLDSAFFDIYVTSTDPELAYEVVCIIKEIAPKFINDVTKHTSSTTTVKDDDGNEETIEIQPVSILTIPKYHEVPSSPNLLRNVTIAAVIALIVAYIMFFLIAFLDSTIRTKKDVTDNIKAPLVGTIPSWDTGK